MDTFEVESLFTLLHLGEVTTEASNQHGRDDHNEGVVEHNLVLAHLQEGERRGGEGQEGG